MLSVFGLVTLYMLTLLLLEPHPHGGSRWGRGLCNALQILPEPQSYDGHKDCKQNKGVVISEDEVIQSGRLLKLLADQW